MALDPIIGVTMDRLLPLLSERDQGSVAIYVGDGEPWFGLEHAVLVLAEAGVSVPAEVTDPMADKLREWIVAGSVTEERVKPVLDGLGALSRGVDRV